VADYQKKRVAALNFQTKLKSDKSDTLRAINRAMSENDYDAIQRAMQKKADFNAKYPSLYAIDDDTLNKSYEAYEEVRDKTERGVKIEDDELPYYNFLIDGGEL
jgi:succinate dehydrogenase/fumarate reductase flavoprotein subunit